MNLRKAILSFDLTSFCTWEKGETRGFEGAREPKRREEEHEIDQKDPSLERFRVRPIRSGKEKPARQALG